MKWTRLGWYGLLLVPLIFLALFFLYPLITILDVSLRPEGRLDLSGFVRLITSAYYRDLLAFTIKQAVISTVCTIAFALPGAYVFTRYKFPGKSLLLSLSTLTFVLPTVVVAVAFTALVGQEGLLNQVLMSIFTLENPPIQLERTLPIIIIVHVFYNYSIALRMISGFWANQSLRIEEAARVLGCSGWRMWWYVRLPMIRPAILAAAVLVFIFTFTSFGVILILGGPQFATLEVEIYYQVQNFLNLPVAAALSLVQIGIMFLMMLLYTRLQRQMPADLQHSGQIARSPASTYEWGLVIGVLFIMIVLLFAPLAALLLRSLMTSPGTLSTDYYIALLTNQDRRFLPTSPLEAIGNSLSFALITTILSLILGVLTAYLLGRRQARLSRLLDPLFMLPLATSAVTLGFGFIIALDEPPLNLRTSWVLIPIAHTLVAMPFVVRSVLPALRSIPPTLQESAGVLGASPLQRWRHVELPLISRGLIVGGTFAFTISMGEFGASLFVARTDAWTIPLVIFRLLNRPILENYGQALAMSVLLMLVCGIAFIIIERIRTTGIGEF